MIPYGRQYIDEDDVRNVSITLREDMITTGTKIDEFEQAICNYTGVKYGVAVSSGTAALHVAMFAIGIEVGDEVILPPITFAATANSVLYQGGTPVFCDVNPDTLLIDVDKVEELITEKTKAIIAVDFAGQVCDYKKLKQIALKHNLFLVSDACHSIGAMSPIADITIYSFHPVKHITTGEGGMATTNNLVLAEKMRQFRTHGIKDGLMYDLGYNYRINDFQCALGISQLKKLDKWIEKRKEIAKVYDERLTVEKLKTVSNHVYHLYVIKVPRRDEVLNHLRNRGIRATVHYMPVYHHPYYQNNGYDSVKCPEAERAYEQIISIPIYPKMTKEDQDYVIKTLGGIKWLR